MRGVALGGFMGVGKTTVGRQLAAALELPFVDLDEELERRFGAIELQFSQDGERTFRERERAIICELMDGTPRVVSTGGGAWVDPRNRAALGELGVRVVLTAPIDVLRRRLGDGEGRPLWDASVEALWRARSDAYADADLVVDTGRLDVAGTVNEIRKALGEGSAASIRVELGERSYDVLVGADGWSGLGSTLDDLGLYEVAVVADPVVGSLHGTAVREALGDRVKQWVEPAVGEANKTLGTLGVVLDGLLSPGFHRKRAVVALGGGVLGDVAGLAAAVAMRGVPFVQLPTTLLSMVDSSVGGKTAVNHAQGKNLIGAFHQPRLVWAALDALDTLPRRELRAGLAEAVKTALLGDADLLDELERHGPMLSAGGARGRMGRVIARCVQIKASVVAKDERESGWRAVLNLGHTVAHALEAVLGGERISHGEAVSIGLVLEARWALAAGHCEDSSLPDRIERILRSIGLPTSLPVTDRDGLTAAMRLDKKASSDRLTLPVPVRAGSATLVNLPTARVGELLPET